MKRNGETGLNIETVIRYLTMAVVVVTALPVHELAHGLVARPVGRPYSEGTGKADLKSVCAPGPVWNTGAAVIWLWLGQTSSGQSKPF